MELQNHAYKWTIGTYAGPQGISPETRMALGKLGFRLIAHSLDEMGLEGGILDCDVRLADERYSLRVPSLRADPTTPIITITSSAPRSHEDPRVIGSIRRPACLQPLYSMLQGALEDTPRSTPRIDTQLPAQCEGSDRRWSGSVVSLSAKGCLLRSNAEIDYGTRVSLRLALPGHDVFTEARCVSRVGDDAGLVFHDTTMGERESIIHYVVDRLTTS